MNPIQQAIFDHLPRTKQAPSGWVSFNAVCCHHNGENTDKRGRGGVITDGDSISYHCFNCGFKTGWKPGRHISFKLRKLLDWLGVDDNERQRLTFEALRIKDEIGEVELEEPELKVEFKARPLPENAIEAKLGPPHIVNYCKQRKLPLNKILWSDTKPGRMYRRIIIPFTWQGNVIGSTSRATDTETKPKYFNNFEPNYVYGIDNQSASAKFSILCEGPIDAMSVNGVAVLSNRVSEVQAEIVDTLGREIIVVPDRDEAGQALVDEALKYGWSVSFPEWENDVKDINAAVVRYGRLFTLKSIINAKQHNRIKINLLRKKL